MLPHLRDSKLLPTQRNLQSVCPVPKWRNWQTRVVQVHVLARVWGFESLLRHQVFQINDLLPWRPPWCPQNSGFGVHCSVHFAALFCARFEKDCTDHRKRYMQSGHILYTHVITSGLQRLPPAWIGREISLTEPLRHAVLEGAWKGQLRKRKHESLFFSVVEVVRFNCPRRC